METRYQEAKKSPEYLQLINNGYKDISTPKQQKNGTFIFEVDYKEIHYGGRPPFDYWKEKKKYGVFKIKLSPAYKVKTQMESHPMRRPEVAHTYEMGFNDIFRLHEKYMKTKRKNPRTLELEKEYELALKEKRIY